MTGPAEIGPSNIDDTFRLSLREFFTITCGIPTPSEELIDNAVIAFTTPDYAKEMEDSGLIIEGSDRLEFYGDGVVKHIICKELYVRYPSMTKGDMSFIAEHLWSNKSYPECMYRAGICITPFLRLSRGINGQPKIPRLQAMFSKIGNAFEALVGALDLCGYYDEAVKLVRRTIDSEMEWAVRFLKEKNLKAGPETFNLRGKELKETFVQRIILGDH